MGWESKGKTRYYTRSRRVGNRVDREYYGGGRLGELAAEIDAASRLLRDEVRVASRSEQDVVRPLQALQKRYDRALREWLVTIMAGAGYARHSGPRWRKRRTLPPPEPPAGKVLVGERVAPDGTIVPIYRDPLADEHTDPSTLVPLHGQDDAEVNQASSHPDPNDDVDPLGVAESKLERLSAQACDIEAAWAGLMAAGRPEDERAARRMAAAWRAEVHRPADPPELTPLRERVVLARLEARYFAGRYTIALTRPLTQRATAFIAARNVGSEKKLAFFVKELMRVRGLLLAARTAANVAAQKGGK